MRVFFIRPVEYSGAGAANQGIPLARRTAEFKINVVEQVIRHQVVGLHRSCLPLAEVDQDGRDGTGGIARSEGEGMCEL